MITLLHSLLLLIAVVVFGGDPINRIDPDGRMDVKTFRDQVNMLNFNPYASTFSQGLGDVAFGVYDAIAGFMDNGDPWSRQDRKSEYGNFRQQIPAFTDAALDTLQSGMDYMGAIPGVGNVFDGINVGISLARSEYAAAARRAAFAAPVVGIGAYATYKAVKAGSKYVSKALKVSSGAKFSAGATNNAATSWTNRFPGVQVRQFGNTWVKRVNPNSSKLMQRWGQMTINKQAAGLSRLRAAGRPAANSRLHQSGRLEVENVGKPLGYGQYLNPRYWGTRFKDSRAMGTFLNDLRPGNCGSGFRAFDPAIDPIQAGIGIGGGSLIGWGAYEMMTE